MLKVLIVVLFLFGPAVFLLLRLFLGKGYGHKVDKEYK